MYKIEQLLRKISDPATEQLQLNILLNDLVNVSYDNNIILTRDKFKNSYLYNKYLSSFSLTTLIFGQEKFTLRVIEATGIPLGSHTVTLPNKWDKYWLWRIKAFGEMIPLGKLGDTSRSEKERRDMITYIEEDFGGNIPIENLSSSVSHLSQLLAGGGLIYEKKGLYFLLSHSNIDFVELYNSADGPVINLLNSIISNQV